MTTTEQPDIVWDQVKKRFRAYLTQHGKRQFLGYFQTPEDAAMARKQSAHIHVDSFAHDVSARPIFENDPGPCGSARGVQ